MGRCRLVVLDKTIEVACAPARAYQMLAEPRRAPAWQPWTPVANVTGPGRFAMVHDVLGVRLRWSGRAEADPCSRIEFAQEEGEFEAMEGAWTVSATDAGCRVRMRMRVELPFVLPVLLTDAAIRSALSTNLDEALYNLKTMLEEPAHSLLRARPGAGLPRAMPAAEA